MICIVDYDAGNLTSVKRALDYLGRESKITSEPSDLADAERIIFPGVGRASSAMVTLAERGLDDALRNAYAKGTPILGICLGTQIILSHSQEDDTACLGVLDGECPRFQPVDQAMKVPHMGWNAITLVKDHPVLRDVNNGDEYYFVHSFYPYPSDKSQVYAVCEYGVEFPAAIGNANLIATQFHPEKSGKFGLKLLDNFCSWDGAVC